MTLKITHVDAREWMRPMVATPPVQLVRDEPEPQDMGDALALDEAILRAVPHYQVRWFAYLGTPEGGAA